MQEITAIVDSAIRIDRKAIRDRSYERLRQAFAVDNPDYVYRRRTKRNTFGVPAKLHMVEEDEGEIRIPRGAVREVKALLEQDGCSVRFIDNRVSPSESIGVKLRPGIGYLYQRTGAAAFIQATQGYAILPCGGGKTILGMLAIAELDRPTMILVHTDDLSDQWRGVSEDLLGVAPAVFKNGREASAYTVATVQTFAKWDPRFLTDLLSRYAFVILDECHHVPAYSFRRILGRSASRYRLGLTATPGREDGLDLVLPAYLGKPICQKTQRELVDLGVLVMPDVRMLETDFTYPYEKHTDWGPMLDAIEADQARNALIVSHIEREAKAGCVSLVLSGRRAHCEALGAILRDRGVPTKVVTGAKTKRQRKSAIAAARDGASDARVLIATSLADEGLDVQILSRVFLTWPGRAKARNTQRLGRLMREHPDKPHPVLFDFADMRVPILRRQANDRMKLYMEILGAPQRELMFDDPAQAPDPFEGIDTDDETSEDGSLAFDF